LSGRSSGALFSTIVSPALLRPIMNYNALREAFGWFGESDPMAVCWAVAGPPDEDDEDDEPDSYSRGGDIDDDDDLDDEDDEEEEDEEEDGTLWAGHA